MRRSGRVSDGTQREAVKKTEPRSAAANPAAPTIILCANEGCGRPRLEAPGVKLCSVCRIAYLTGYRDHVSKAATKAEARLRVLEP